MKIRKAIIPAAGLGTRFLPATKAQPKEMLPIVDKPSIQYIIEEAVEAGIEDILIITGRSKRAIEDHFDYSPELERELEKKRKAGCFGKPSEDLRYGKYSVYPPERAARPGPRGILRPFFHQ